MAGDQFPPLAGVDGVPDGALVADGPAFGGVDELDGVQGGVLGMAHLAGAGGGGEDGSREQQRRDGDDGSHNRPSVGRWAGGPA